MQTKYIQRSDKMDDLINRIIDREWLMFQRVEGLEGRAPCQDDGDTFYLMRYSQHSAFNREVLDSYLRDLINATVEGRNLIIEKYGFMMETTDPDYYREKVEPCMTPISESKAQILGEILQIMGWFREEYRAMYPKLTKRGRPEEASQEVSAAVYLRGELKTYSETTLRLYLDYIKDLKVNGINPVCLIQERTVKFYGFQSLEDAEARVK